MARRWPRACRLRAGAAARVALDALLALLLAPRCGVCDDVIDAPSRGPVCQRCWASLRVLTPPWCVRCGEPLPSWRVHSLALGLCPRCRRVASAIDLGRSCVSYDATARAIIHAFKYEHRVGLARPLASLMRRQAPEVLADIDTVVPVPLHWRRRWLRGFNQAAALAGALGLPTCRALRKTCHTPPQVGLPAAARWRNLRGAFRVRRIRSVRAAIAGRSILLVDDVRTTGATLEACAVALKEAGAKEVRALTVARAPARRR